MINKFIFVILNRPSCFLTCIRLDERCFAYIFCSIAKCWNVVKCGPTGLTYLRLLHTRISRTNTVTRWMLIVISDIFNDICGRLGTVYHCIFWFKWCYWRAKVCWLVLFLFVQYLEERTVCNKNGVWDLTSVDDDDLAPEIYEDEFLRGPR